MKKKNMHQTEVILQSICLSHEFIDESHCQFEIPYLSLCPWLRKEIDRQENEVEEQRTVCLCWNTFPLLLIPLHLHPCSSSVIFPNSFDMGLSLINCNCYLSTVFEIFIVLHFLMYFVGCIIIFTRGSTMTIHWTCISCSMNITRFIGSTSRVKREIMSRLV